MIWLAAQMWLLLAAAFALGVAIGAWLGRPRAQPQPLETNNADVDGSLAADFSPQAPTLYSSPVHGAKDDLTQIIGLGRRDESSLNAIGVFYLRQIAEWGPARAQWIEEKLDFRGRVSRERWVEQARAALD